MDRTWQASRKNKTIGEKMNKIDEILWDIHICGLRPKNLGKPNVKSGAEMQQEACKGKTIVEVLNNENPKNKKNQNG